jgi:F-type H+-transporting ATPase subunit gamma
MANLQHIRKRIQAVKNTEQITKAMKMVAAAKFRKAQDAVLHARPFAREMRSTLGRLAKHHEEVGEHALMVAREPAETEDLFVLTSDRGRCGSFNSNVHRKVEHYLLDHQDRRDRIFLSTIGSKGYKYFSKQKAPIRQNVEELLNKPTYRRAVELADDLAGRYIAGEVDRITLVFNEFRSAVQQEVVFRTLLPLQAPESSDEQRDFIDYIYEPDKNELLDRIIRRYLANQIYMFILESVTSEHGARMTAMENATENAGEMIQQLTMVYNKARQASITKELMEIVSGAEALKG